MSGLGHKSESDEEKSDEFNPVSEEVDLVSIDQPYLHGKGADLFKLAGWSGPGANMQEPIVPNATIGSRGLGDTTAPATLPGSMNAKHKVSPDRLASVSVRNRDKKPIEWLHSPEQLFPYDYKFDEDLIVGTERHDYDLYCSKEKVEALFACKDKLESVDRRTFFDSRRRANPYEIIGKSVFINRAAVKLANLDYLCNLVPGKEADRFFFCDVCAGPGGFTEYVLWKRHGIHSRGWGMTLKGNDDWKFYRFNEYASVKGRFEAIYGPDGTGNVYKEENLRHFQNAVLHGTDGKGVHLYTADGGFCVDGNENYQEVEVKRLVLNQFLCMLCVLRKGGHFVCKIFDVFTPFTIGLLYILYRLFDDFAIVKPVTSRPANSERYVVCKNFREQKPESVIEYLFRVNTKFDSKMESEDVIQVIDRNLIQKDTYFMEYLRNSNLTIIDAQIAALEDLVLYIEDLHLEPFADQKKVREYALQLWRIPSEPVRHYGNRGRGRGNNRGYHQGRHHYDHNNQHRREYDNRGHQYSNERGPESNPLGKRRELPDRDSPVAKRHAGEKEGKSSYY